MKIDGHCHCGAIQYEAEVDPERVYVCHCTDCQSISGGTFRWAVPLPAADFRLLSGAPKTYVKTAESGRISHQVFCPDCASPIYSTLPESGQKSINLRLGTARQRAQLRPRKQIWCGSAQEWATLQGPIESLEKQ